MNEVELPFKPLLKIADVQKILQVSRSKIYVLLNQGELKSVRVGSSQRFTHAQIEEYIRKLESQESL